MKKIMTSQMHFMGFIFFSILFLNHILAETLITFTYDPETHLVTTSPIASGFSSSCLPQVVLAGSFQDELGCSSDWDANCTNTALYYVPGTGQFENDLSIPPGYYEYRAI